MDPFVATFIVNMLHYGRKLIATYYLSPILVIFKGVFKL